MDDIKGLITLIEYQQKKVDILNELLESRREGNAKLIITMTDDKTQTVINHKDQSAPEFFRNKKDLYEFLGKRQYTEIYWR